MLSRLGFLSVLRFTVVFGYRGLKKPLNPQERTYVSKSIVFTYSEEVVSERTHYKS